MSKQRKKITSEILSPEDRVIEQLKARKQPKTSENDKATLRVTLDIPKELHTKIKAHTKARGQTIKGYLLGLAYEDINS